MLWNSRFWTTLPTELSYAVEGVKLVNIKFGYLYRDSGNYKNWGEVIFSNPSGLTKARIETLIRRALVDSEYFVPSDVNLTTLYFEKFDRELDHDWHEFSGIEATEEEPTDAAGRSIEAFASELWKSFELMRD